MTQERIKWRTDMEKVILEVQKRPLIWDKTHKFHKNNLARTEAWQDILEELSTCYHEMTEGERKYAESQIRSQWKYLRRQYTIEHKKVVRLGAEIPKWRYYKTLNFLSDENVKQKSHCNSGDNDERNFSSENNDDKRNSDSCNIDVRISDSSSSSDLYIELVDLTDDECIDTTVQLQKEAITDKNEIIQTAHDDETTGTANETTGKARGRHETTWNAHERHKTTRNAHESHDITRSAHERHETTWNAHKRHETTWNAHERNEMTSSEHEENTTQTPNERKTKEPPLTVEIPRKSYSRKRESSFSRMRTENKEVDENMLFFKTLLPHIEKIPQDKMLSFRNAIQNVVQEFAYADCSQTKIELNERKSVKPTLHQLQTNQPTEKINLVDEQDEPGTLGYLYSTFEDSYLSNPYVDST